jgi:hypothetical protein
MRRLRFVGLVVLLLSLVIGGMVDAQGAREPELLIPLLNDGDAVAGTFDADSLMQLYAFNGSAGDNVTVNLAQADGAIDPLVVLLGGRGEVVATSDQTGTIEGIELPADGSYFILVTGLDVIESAPDSVIEGVADGQSYQVAVSGMTEPTNMRNYRAGGLNYLAGKLTVGDQGIAETTRDYPIYYFTFDAAAGDVVNIGLTTENFEALLYLFAPDGRRLAVDANGASAAISGVEIPEDGRYLIFATDASFYNALQEDWDGYGEFNISLG